LTGGSEGHDGLLQEDAGDDDRCDLGKECPPGAAPPNRRTQASDDRKECQSGRPMHEMMG
jgi:hypothetical protein